MCLKFICLNLGFLGKCFREDVNGQEPSLLMLIWVFLGFEIGIFLIVYVLRVVSALVAAFP